MTNTSYLWEKIKVFESAIRSDHNMVIACPRTSAEAKRSTIQFRDVREHRKIHMAYLLESYFWQEVFSAVDCELKCDELSNTLGPCFASISRCFLFVHPPGILLSFRHWLNIF